MFLTACHTTEISEGDKMNKKMAVTSVLLVVVLFGGTIVYFNDKIALMNNEMSNLSSQISTLAGQLTNLSSAYLVTALGTHELTFQINNAVRNNPSTINYLSIMGKVTNTGRGTAYNAGLLVVAYNNTTGKVEIDMTVPLGSGTFGVDSSTDAFVANQFGNISSLQLGYLGSEQTAVVNASIYHENTVSNWTITPVWTNTP